ncbi:MAG: hypothetical protein ACO3UU_08260, partial [Minisyncoccia bacterium]
MNTGPWDKIEFIHILYFYLDKMELPDEIVDLILSYGDVLVTQRYCGVIRQLNYYKNEFSYQIKNPWSHHWRNKPAFYYPLFIFTKCKIKKNLTEYITPIRPSKPYRNILYETGMQIDHSIHIIYDIQPFT